MKEQWTPGEVHRPLIAEIQAAGSSALALFATALNEEGLLAPAPEPDGTGPRCETFLSDRKGLPDRVKAFIDGN